MGNLITPTLSAPFDSTFARINKFRFANIPTANGNPQTSARAFTGARADTRLAELGRGGQSITPNASLVKNYGRPLATLLTRADHNLNLGREAQRNGNYQVAYNQYSEARGLINSAMTLVQRDGAALLSMGDRSLHIERALHSLPGGYAPIF